MITFVWESCKFWRVETGEGLKGVMDAVWESCKFWRLETTTSPFTVNPTVWESCKFLRVETKVSDAKTRDSVWQPYKSIRVLKITSTSHKHPGKKEAQNGKKQSYIYMYTIEKWRHISHWINRARPRYFPGIYHKKLISPCGDTYYHPWRFEPSDQKIYPLDYLESTRGAKNHQSNSGWKNGALVGRRAAGDCIWISSLCGSEAAGRQNPQILFYDLCVGL